VKKIRIFFSGVFFWVIFSAGASEKSAKSIQASLEPLVERISLGHEDLAHKIGFYFPPDTVVFWSAPFLSKDCQAVELYNILKSTTSSFAIASGPINTLSADEPREMVVNATHARKAIEALKRRGISFSKLGDDRKVKGLLGFEGCRHQPVMFEGIWFTGDAICPEIAALIFLAQHEGSFPETIVFVDAIEGPELDSCFSERSSNQLRMLFSPATFAKKNKELRERNKACFEGLVALVNKIAISRVKSIRVLSLPHKLEAQAKKEFEAAASEPFVLNFSEGHKGLPRSERNSAFSPFKSPAPQGANP